MVQADDLDYFGKKIDISRMANSSASNIVKQGAFYVFSIRLSAEDVREYSFTNRDKAYLMRGVLIEHLENKLRMKVVNV